MQLEQFEMELFLAYRRRHGLAAAGDELQHQAL